MINKLKKKFIILATVSMLILMTVLVTIMNLVNYSSVINESDTILDVLNQPNAPFFDDQSATEKKEINQDMGDFIPRGMSPETPYESRFFRVVIDSNGETINSDLSKIVSVDESTVDTYIEKALSSNNDRGFVGQFRFLKTENEFGTEILFLDCGRKLESFTTFLWISIIVGMLGCIIVFVGFLFVSGKIVRPIAESYEKQKRFISDASHEIKTPLTIINANVDLLESDGLEKEELTDIRQQTLRLTKMTNDMVLLSKMEEQGNEIRKIEMPLSDILLETANAFNALATSKNINYSKQILPNVSMNGNPDGIKQLASILLDNAMKYVPEGGTVGIGMNTHKKNVAITVFNTTEEKMSEKELSHLFDRFYRTDKSRNSETGGHGIGLSIAKAIVDNHGGTINAYIKNDNLFVVNVIISL